LKSIDKINDVMNFPSMALIC